MSGLGFPPEVDNAAAGVALRERCQVAGETGRYIGIRAMGVQSPYADSCASFHRRGGRPLSALKARDSAASLP